jgi:YkoY family integral membrane protein
VEFIHYIFGPDLDAALLIILNLVLIESLLSVDNAAVLATMVMDLPPEQRKKALKYGIIGAYFFRGLCLVLASWLIKIWWLKPLGGLYLLWLTIDYFRREKTPTESDDLLEKEHNWFYAKTFGLIGPFWATVALVELMDLAFSLDNVFAAVALADNISDPQRLYIVCIGVFIGILAMRFVAQSFVKLMEKYPFLETAAFVVIGILGAKLLSSVITHLYPHTMIGKILENETTDAIVSLITLSVFVVPILTSKFLGFPGKAKN